MQPRYLDAFAPRRRRTQALCRRAAGEQKDSAAGRQRVEVLVDFDAFASWICTIENSRGETAYGAIDRRATRILRRLRALGVELHFIASGAGFTSDQDALRALARRSWRLHEEAVAACRRAAGAAQEGPLVDALGALPLGLAERQLQATLRRQGARIDCSPSLAAQQLQEIMEAEPGAAGVLGDEAGGLWLAGAGAQWRQLTGLEKLALPARRTRGKANAGSSPLRQLVEDISPMAEGTRGNFKAAPREPDVPAYDALTRLVRDDVQRGRLPQWLLGVREQGVMWRHVVLQDADTAEPSGLDAMLAPLHRTAYALVPPRGGRALTERGAAGPDELGSREAGEAEQLPLGLEELRALPRRQREWLLARLLRVLGRHEPPRLHEWSELGLKLQASGSGDEAPLDQDAPQESAAAVVTYFAERSDAIGQALSSVELSALARTLEFSRPRIRARATRMLLEQAIDRAAPRGAGGEMLEYLSTAMRFEGVLGAIADLAQMFAARGPWELEPRHSFDASLFARLCVVFEGGVNLRRSMGGSLVASRAARLARLLADQVPLDSDDEDEREAKLEEAEEREEDAVEEGLERTFAAKPTPEPVPVQGRFDGATSRSSSGADSAAASGETAPERAEEAPADPQTWGVEEELEEAGSVVESPADQAAQEAAPKMQAPYSEALRPEELQLDGSDDDDDEDSELWDLLDPDTQDEASGGEPAPPPAPRSRGYASSDKDWRSVEQQRERLWEAVRAEDAAAPAATSQAADLHSPDASETVEEQRAGLRAHAPDEDDETLPSRAEPKAEEPHSADGWETLEEQRGRVWADAPDDDEALLPRAKPKAEELRSADDSWETLEEQRARLWGDMDGGDARRAEPPAAAPGGSRRPGSQGAGAKSTGPRAWETSQLNRAKAWTSQARGRAAPRAQQTSSGQDLEEAWAQVEELEGWEAAERERNRAWSVASAAEEAAQLAANSPSVTSPIQTRRPSEEQLPSTQWWRRPSVQEAQGPTAEELEDTWARADEDEAWETAERDRDCAWGAAAGAGGLAAEGSAAIPGLEEAWAMADKAKGAGSAAPAGGDPWAEAGVLEGVSNEEEDREAWEELRAAIDHEHAMAWGDVDAEEIEDEEVEAEAVEEEKASESPPAQPAGRESLPIEEFREEILRQVRLQRVTILAGSTGCGKSTQVPKYLAEEAGARVLVTQPRRVAAVEIARRVAAERGEKLGENVGYRISGESRPGSGLLQFATVGYVIAWFLGKPEAFASFTHIVLDEVHERGADMEMFLLLAKLLMHIFPGTKLILMSATLQAAVFGEYFSEFLAGESLPPISVEGRTFPVQEVFLDELLESGSEWRASLKPRSLAAAGEALGEFESACEDANWLLKRPRVMPGLERLALALVPLLARPNSTMIVFLPGLVELGEMSDLFSSLSSASTSGAGKDPRTPSGYEVFVMHSAVPRAEQEAALRPPTGGVCNVVLASNIAESSLTLPNVTAVIDFGLHREIVHDAKQRLSRLVTAWCSHASARQRAGRAGRTQPGVAVRLFPRRFFEEKMPEFDTPEILRASLSKLLLRVKNLSRVLKAASVRYAATRMPVDVGSARALLGYLPQPPDVGALNAAVSELAVSGALAAEDEASDLTSLGIFAEGLPLELNLCRLLWLGALWGCLAEAIVMAAACASSDPFTCPSRMLLEDTDEYVGSLRRSLSSRKRFDGGHFSEPLMWLRLFRHWAAEYAPSRYSSGGSSRKARQAWNVSSQALAAQEAIVPRNMQQFILRVSDLAERLLRLDLPGPSMTVLTALKDVEGLLRLVEQGRSSDGKSSDGHQIFRAEAPLLKMLLAAAFCDHLLVGRRFMDQLRGPSRAGPKPERLRGEKEASGEKKAKPQRRKMKRKKKALWGDEDEAEDEEEEEEDEWMYVSEDEEEDDDYEYSYGDDGKGEEEDEDLKEDLEEEDEEEEEDDDGEPAGFGDETGEEDAGEGGEKAPWFETRNAMLDAVNSLPVRGRASWQRVVVVRLKDNKAPAGAWRMDQVPRTLEKLCGRKPVYSARMRSDAKYAAASFSPEPKTKALPSSGLPEAEPPVLLGASSDASLCYMFSMGRSVFDVDGEEVARPTSPYLLTFFLPERESGKREEKQRQVRGLLDVRNPVGFPCHVQVGEDFFCVAAGLQLTESLATVRTEGATILPAIQAVFALATLSPERSALQLCVEKAAAGSRLADAGEECITAVRIHGWELSLAGSGAAPPAAKLLDVLGRVRAGIRSALRAGAAAASEEPRRRLRGAGLDRPERAALDLVELLEAASSTAATGSRAPPRDQRRSKPPKDAWKSPTLLDDATGHVDHLRPLGLGPAVDPQAAYRCPVCEKGFRAVSACKKHLKSSGHLQPAKGQSWRSLMEERCRLGPDGLLLEPG